MDTVSMTPGSSEEIKRCDERSWLAVEEQNGVPKTRNADGSLAEKVDRALQSLGVLVNTGYQEVDVIVKDGTVFLSGHVATTSMIQRAEAAVRAIPGVLGMKSYLVSDETIMGAVSVVLARIEHQHKVKFFTGVQNGVVMLNGDVPSSAVRLLAEKQTALIPGVRAVLNFVRTPDFNSIEVDQRFLQPVIGEPIFFSDGLLGTVQKVVIEPDNRRVTGMIIQRQTPYDHSGIGSMMGGKTILPEGLILIQMHSIRYMTKTSGFLHINSADTAQYWDFEPAAYQSPAPGWMPPYPYCPEDVLFQVDQPVEIDTA